MTRGRASPRGAAVGVRAAAAGGGRDARGAQPRLAPRHDRARPGAVRRRARDRVGRRDHPARRRGARRAPTPRLEQQIKTAPVVNIDETGWKTAGGNRTLWGALTSRTAVFRIAAGRHGFEARTLLGERFAGIVCSDRWRGYDYLDPTPAAALLGAPAPRLHRPQRRHGRAEDGSATTASRSPTTSSPPGTPTSTTATAPGCKRRSRRSKRSCARCSSTPPARARSTKYHRAVRQEPPQALARASGPSPTPTASSRPTTTPNAASAAPSSTASSHSAANPSTANAPSNDSSPPRSPAASANARSSPTSPTSSPPTSAATPSPRSPDHPGAERLRKERQ